MAASLQKKFILPANKRIDVFPITLIKNQTPEFIPPKFLTKTAYFSILIQRKAIDWTGPFLGIPGIL